MKKYYILLLCCLSSICTLNTFGQVDTVTLLNCRDAIVTCSSTPFNKSVAGIKHLGNNYGAPLGGTASLSTTWSPSTTMPSTWNRDSLGEVFGTAIDNIGNVYLAGTALYSTFRFLSPHLYDFTKSTYPVQPPISGNNKGYGNAGSGGIYKADGNDLNVITPLVSSVSSTSTTPSGVGTKTIINNGYGIGNIAFSSTVNKLYATNIEDGTILVINSTSGNIDQIFDPFIPDSGSVEIPPLGERLFGIAIQEVSTTYNPRVYFSRLLANGISEIHSVEINSSNGLLINSTLTLEITKSHTYQTNAIVDIAFSDRGELLLAEKGNNHASGVFKYLGDHNAWSIEEKRIVSAFNAYDANCAGGVDFGPKQIGQGIFGCDSLIWAMSNAIAVDYPVYNTYTYYGAISQPLEGYIDESKYHEESHIVHLGLQKGLFGDIEFYDCSCGEEFNSPCSEISIEPIAVDSIIEENVCCYRIELINTYNDQYFTGFEVNTNTANIIHASSQNYGLGVQYNSPFSTSFTYSHDQHMPLTSDTNTYITVCFEGELTNNIEVNYIGNLPQNDTVCSLNFEAEGCSEDLPATCALISDQTIECKDGIYQMSFSVENLADFIMRGITLYSLDSNLYPIDYFLPIADLQPDSSGQYTIPMYFDGFNFDANGNKIDETCFMFSACDVNVNPLLSGIYPDNCCLDSIEYCATIPDCGFGNGGCYGIDMTYSQKDSNECCFDLDLNVSEVSSPIQCIKFTGNAGAQFALFSGWNIQPGVTSNQVTLCSPGDYLLPGNYSDFANFCLTGYAQNPYEIAVQYIDTNGHTICIDSLNIQSNCELVEPSCINFTNYALECQGDSTVFTFDIHNNSNFDVKQFEIRNEDTNLTLSQTLIIPDSAILQDQIQGSYQILIDNFSGNSVEELCLYLTAHNEVYDTLKQTAATICCTDSIGSSICVPLPYCGPDTTQQVCCGFDHLTIPNGITPNNDGVNDIWEIVGLETCDQLSIIIFNRWGNEIYSDDNYTNNWDGKNDNGNVIAQGTYYIKMTLASGESHVQFIDVRY